MCDVLLALIGPQWVARDVSGRRRLHDPNDYVRREIAAALQRDDVRVIPLLVSGAEMPRAEELPDDLKPLVSRQNFQLRYERFNADVNDLIAQLAKVVSPAGKRRLLKRAMRWVCARGRAQRPNGAEAFSGTGRAVRDAVFLPIKLTTVVEGPEVGQTLMKSIRLLLSLLCSDARWRTCSCAARKRFNPTPIDRPRCAGAVVVRWVWLLDCRRWQAGSREGGETGRPHSAARGAGDLQDRPS